MLRAVAVVDESVHIGLMAAGKWLGTGGGARDQEKENGEHLCM
jgi:hypothetical protein